MVGNKHAEADHAMQAIWPSRRLLHRMVPRQVLKMATGASAETPVAWWYKIAAALREPPKKTQTSSMRAIGALSPWRGPSFKMRV